MLDFPCCLWYNIRGEYFFFFFFLDKTRKMCKNPTKIKNFLSFLLLFTWQKPISVLFFFQGQTDRGRGRKAVAAAAAAASMTKYRVNEKNFMRKSICGSGEIDERELYLRRTWKTRLDIWDPSTHRRKRSDGNVNVKKTELSHSVPN